MSDISELAAQVAEKMGMRLNEYDSIAEDLPRMEEYDTATEAGQEALAYRALGEMVNDMHGMAALLCQWGTEPEAIFQAYLEWER